MRGRGGYVGFNRVPSLSAARGVWTLREVEEAKRAGTWPIAVTPYLVLEMEGTNGSTTFANQNGITVTAHGNAQIRTEHFKVGASSAFFDGDEDGLFFIGPAFGTGDFTIECWTKLTGGQQYAQIFGNESGTQGFTFVVNNNYDGDGQLALYSPLGGVFQSGSTTIADNAWHHVVLMRRSNAMRIFVDGVSVATASDASSYTSSANMWIGRNNLFSGRSLNGYVDQFRITLAAIYADSGFTPPM